MNFVRSFERINNSSNISQQIHIGNKIFASALRLKNSTEGNKLMVLGVLERLIMCHPNPVKAITEVCHMLYEDVGEISQDLPKRFRYLQQGAALGDIDCMHMLAMTYHFGLGTPVNYTEAKRLYRLLFFGHTEEIPLETRSDVGLALARLVITGYEPSIYDVTAAFEIYEELRSSAINGVAASLHFGRALRTDFQHVRADPTKAWSVYWDALRLPNRSEGIGEVLYEMGTMAEDGEGLEFSDLRVARFLYARAVHEGYPDAQEALEAIS